MLSVHKLMVLAKHHEGINALSAYIPVPPSTANPVAAVGIALRSELAALRQTLSGASHDERMAFDECAAKLEACATHDVHRQGGGTWIAFAGANGTTHDEMISDTLPLTVAWGNGLRIVPYLAACDVRPALVAIVDREHAQFFRHEHGALIPLEHFKTHASVDAGPHMSAPPRQGFHVGTHGEPGGEVAARKSEAAFRQHVTRIADRITALDRDHEWIVVGGGTNAVKELMERITKTRESRVGVIDHLASDATPAQILAGVRMTVRALETAHHQRLTADLIGRSAGIDRDVHGSAAVRWSVDRGAAAAVVIAAPWMYQHAVDAEKLVRDAIAQGATVDIVTGDAAAQLGAKAGGLAARLRYAIEGTVRAESGEHAPTPMRV